MKLVPFTIVPSLEVWRVIFQTLFVFSSQVSSYVRARQWPILREGIVRPDYREGFQLEQTRSHCSPNSMTNLVFGDLLSTMFYCNYDERHWEAITDGG